MTLGGDLLIGALFAPPLLGVAVCGGLPFFGGRFLLRFNAFMAGLECAAVGMIYLCKPPDQRIFTFGNNLFIDTLSLYHISLVAVVFLMSSLYSLTYFDEEITNTSFNGKRARRFCIIWNGFFAVLMAVLCSNNMGLLWICLEATTLISALLIMTDGHPSSIEAMWKYLLLCSVGIAFAFVGTLLLSVAARNASFAPAESLLWSSLNDRAGLLDGRVMCVAFVFVLVGFGTKAGLAPMHTWLPDAHSQAPTPVSAVFSGIMLNCALYCIMRYLPLCESAMGWTGGPHSMLVFFGLVSIIVAAVFIPSQNNIKRLLAYHSVEHMGIIAFGLGLGGLGTYAALFHTLNHSLSKTLAFFSAGGLARHYGTYDMRKMKGAVSSNPLWGSAFFIAVLALIGVAPFSVFMSELQIVKTAVDDARFPVLAIFLFGSVVVFVSALRHAIDLCMGKDITGVLHPKWFPRDIAAVIALCGVLLASGLFMPHWYSDLLTNASVIIEGSRGPDVFSKGVFR